MHTLGDLDFTSNLFFFHEDQALLSVQACNDVHILLPHNPLDTSQQTYEIVLGMNSNSRSEIRPGVGQASVVHQEEGPLDCDELM